MPAQWLQSTADPTVKGAPALHRRVGQPPQAVLAGRRGMGDGARVAVGPAAGRDPEPGNILSVLLTNRWSAPHYSLLVDK